MKSAKLKFLETVLRLMASLVLKRHKPIIVGITGSVGKTSAKEAVYCVLSEKFNVRRNEKNYNNEIGIPLTIIGAESGGKSFLKWIGVFLKWICVVIFDFKYPEILVIELGVDRPGDMQYLTSFIHPTIGIVTNISSSHIEFFGEIEKISKEKGFLIENLLKGGTAILNADDENVLQMQKRTANKIIFYGFSDNADIRAERVGYNYNDNQKPEGISFKLNYEGRSIPVRLRNILAPYQIYSALSAIAVGIVFKMNLVEASVALEKLHSPCGRMNLIDGIKNTYIIDDTYNASPLSTGAALDVMGVIGAKRRIVVLGDMLELGNETEKGHRQVGGKIFEIKADVFVAVGRRMNFAVKKLISLGYLEKNIFVFENPEIAVEKVRKILEEGDIVLVKGSQGMRMEKIVEGIMADPNQAENVLCRQNREWKKKPFIIP
ncbi:MAG: hypothetical protein ACD_11C00027G0005 [uncultured bacterium]|nr:MAG: hypothetical protein ACD_11C00027G0005 [uncultured bacterium]HBR72068.1 hypothetical protein [Candidatus Moranbacteria bacterium]